ERHGIGIIHGAGSAPEKSSENESMKSAMLRLRIALALGLILIASSALAFEVGATVRSVNVENRTVTVFAGGQVSTVRVARHARILDREGEELPEGLRSRRVTEGH